MFQGSYEAKNIEELKRAYKSLLKKNHSDLKGK